MRDIVELEQERAHQLRTSEDIVARAEKEDRILTDEERGMIAACNKEAKLLQDEIDAREEDTKTKEQVKKLNDEIRKPRQRQTTQDQPNPEPISNHTRIEMPGFVARYGKLKAFDGPNAERDAYISGQWIQAAVFNNYRAKQWCSKNGISVRNDLNEGTNTLGGNLVPEQFEQAIINLRETYGIFRRECPPVPMGRDTMIIPRRTGGVTAAFAAEGALPSSSDPTWNQVQLTAKKLGALTKMSMELAEDAIINLADWLASEFAYAFALKEDQCGFIGDASSTYGGITGLLVVALQSSHSAGKVAAASPNNTFGELTSTDLTKLMSVVPQYARAGAKWYCSQVAYDLVFSRLAAAAGGNTIQTVSGAFAPSYLGYPIVTSQVFPAGPSTDYNAAAMLAFGDLTKAATFGERRGITVSQTNDRYWDTDQIGLKATERIDIVVHDMGDTTTAGPVSVLVGTT